MTEPPPALSIYEETFMGSDVTDAILVVDGKELHVNKALLSMYSHYFRTLFTSEFKEKSMEKIEIKDVKLEHFATLLSLIHPNRIEPTENNAENLLILADRFFLPSAKRYLELFIISSDIKAAEKLRLADKYQLETLMDHSLRSWKMTKTPEPSIYEKAFAKSDKTDAILVIGGKKLHVNKTLLSCHSDYFKALFNSEFKEKSMEEIEIKDVDFENFVTVLSLVHWNRIEPKMNNVEELLELADRFLLPSAKRYLELFIISTNISAESQLRLADKYQLETLIDHSLKNLDSNSVLYKSTLLNFSDKTKAKIFDHKITLQSGAFAKIF